MTSHYGIIQYTMLRGSLHTYDELHTTTKYESYDAAYAYVQRYYAYPSTDYIFVYNIVPL